MADRLWHVTFTVEIEAPTSYDAAQAAREYLGTKIDQGKVIAAHIKLVEEADHARQR